MRFEFATAGRIIFGAGASSELPDLIREHHSPAILVWGKGAAARGGPVADLVSRLRKDRLTAATYEVDREPDVLLVEAGAQLARDCGAESVIGLGGGAVMDAAKAIAGLATNSGSALDYMEVVGAGKTFSLPTLPIYALPTTAGTGSEVTRNAVIGVPEKKVKVSIRSPFLLPHTAIVDPVLTHTLPPQTTAASGLDALTQLLEAYVSCRAQPLTDGFCLEGLACVARSLRRVYHQSENGEAREEMSLASLLSGLALANAGLGAVHGIAAPLGGAFAIPHGAACAALLPYVTAANIRALYERDPGGDALLRYRRVAETLCPNEPTPAGLVRFLKALVAELDITRLSGCGLSPDDVPSLAQKALRASSTRGNPVVLNSDEIESAIVNSL